MLRHLLACQLQIIDLEIVRKHITKYNEKRKHRELKEPKINKCVELKNYYKG